VDTTELTDITTTPTQITSNNVQKETVTDSREASKSPGPPSPDFDFPSLPPSPPPEMDYTQLPAKSGTLASKKRQDKTIEKCDKVGQVNEIRRPQFSSLENDMWENRKSDRKTITGGGTKHSPERKSKSLKSTTPKMKADQRQSSSSRDRDRQVAQELVSRVSAPERKVWRQQDLEEEAWIPQPPAGSSEASRTRRESRSRRRAESEEICEKCHHKKGRRRSKSSDNVLKTRRVDTALPAYDRDREEMEILKRYIRRENPGAEYLCNCAKSTLDFNCRFVYDSKNYKSSKKLRSHGHNKFDF